MYVRICFGFVGMSFLADTFTLRRSANFFEVQRVLIPYLCTYSPLMTNGAHTYVADLRQVSWVRTRPVLLLVCLQQDRQHVAHFLTVLSASVYTPHTISRLYVRTCVFSSCGELVRRRTCSQKNLVLPTRGVRSSVRSCNVSLAVNSLVCRVATGEEEPKKVETADKCVGESIWGDAFLWQTIFDLPPF